MERKFGIVVADGGDSGELTVVTLWGGIEVAREFATLDV